MLALNEGVFVGGCSAPRCGRPHSYPPEPWWTWHGTCPPAAPRSWPPPPPPWPLPPLPPWPLLPPPPWLPLPPRLGPNPPRTSRNYLRVAATTVNARVHGGLPEFLRSMGLSLGYPQRFPGKNISAYLGRAHTGLLSNLSISQRELPLHTAYADDAPGPHMWVRRAIPNAGNGSACGI